MFERAEKYAETVYHWIFGTRKAEEHEIYYYRAQVTGWISVFLLLGLGLVFFWGGHWSVSFAWSLASFAVGAALGFLFGIPKTVQRGAVPKKPEATTTSVRGQSSDAAIGAQSTASSQEPAYRQLVNTNLEEISDWLTKIIVGLTLVEVRHVADYFRNCAASFADGLGGVDQNGNLAFAQAVLVYFLILGFLSGYLLTRLFLAIALRLADEFVVEVRRQVKRERILDVRPKPRPPPTPPSPPEPPTPTAPSSPPTAGETGTPPILPPELGQKKPPEPHDASPPETAGDAKGPPDAKTSQTGEERSSPGT